MASLCRCFSTVARRRLATNAVPAASGSSASVHSSAAGASSSSSSAHATASIYQYNHVNDANVREALRRPMMAAAILGGSNPGQVPSPSTTPTSASASASAPPSSSSSFSTRTASVKAEASSDPSAPTSPPTEATQQAPWTVEIPPAEDPLLSFLTNLMMKDGKKARARTHVSLVLSTLRLRTSQDPMPLLRESIRLAAPGIRITQQKKGGKQVAVPRALNERQRVHKAISWILEASNKRKNPNAGGSKKFGERVALEIEAVLNGTSDVLKKKEQLHAMATVNRANVTVPR